MAGFGVLSDNAGSNFDFISSLKYSLENSASGNSSLKSFSIFTRFIYIEGSDNNEVRRSSKISERNGNSAEIVNNYINIEFNLCGNWDDGCIVSY